MPLCAAVRPRPTWQLAHDVPKETLVIANPDDALPDPTAVTKLRELARWCRSALLLPHGFDTLERAGFRLDREAHPTVLRLWGRALNIQRCLKWQGGAPPGRPTRPEELGTAIADLRRWALRLCVECRRGGLAPVPAVPKCYLFGWREILTAVGLPNNATNRERVSRLNELYEGPIIVPGQGSQPVATEARLFKWWTVWSAGLKKLPPVGGTGMSPSTASTATGRRGLWCQALRVG